MEGNVLLLLFASLCICGMVVLAITAVLDRIQNGVKSAPKSKKSKTPYSFHRQNEVEGILTVNGTKMKTYNIGELCLDNTITLRFFEGFHTDVRITDIFYLGKSLYVFAPAGDWRKKADYALNVLKTLVNEGKLRPSLVSEVEEIILEVETLNQHLTKGDIVRTENDDFVWDA